jgi:hypothetical protein
VWSIRNTYLGKSLTVQNSIMEGNKSRLHSVNACCHSVQNVVSVCCNSSQNVVSVCCHSVLNVAYVQCHSLLNVVSAVIRC